MVRHAQQTGFFVLCKRMLRTGLPQKGVKLVPSGLVMG